MPVPGGHRAEVVEGRLAPAQELVALAVALVFALHVLGEGGGGAEIVDHHRVVDDEIDGHQRVDLLRVAAELGRRIAHRRQIDHGGNAGEVLHQHARRTVGDLVRGLACLKPAGDRADVVGGHRAPVLEAQQVLQQHLQRERQLGDPLKAVGLRIGQGEVGVGLVADGKRLATFEGVERFCHGWRSPFIQGRPAIRRRRHALLAARLAPDPRQAGIRASLRRQGYRGD